MHKIPFGDMALGDMQTQSQRQCDIIKSSLSRFAFKVN